MLALGVDAPISISILCMVIKNNVQISVLVNEKACKALLLTSYD